MKLTGFLKANPHHDTHGGGLPLPIINSG